MKLPQLTLRDLFWAILVAAMATGWGLHHWQTRHAYRLVRDNEILRRDRDRITTQLRGEGYEIEYSSIGPFLTRRPVVTAD
jgi:hypothetical protein